MASTQMPLSGLPPLPVTVPSIRPPRAWTVSGCMVEAAAAGMPTAVARDRAEVAGLLTLRSSRAGEASAGVRRGTGARARVADLVMTTGRDETRLAAPPYHCGSYPPPP